MTSEPPLPWDRPYPWDAHLEQIRTVPARDEDKTEWIKAHLNIRFWMRYLSVYSDLSRHGGVELDPATGLARVVRFKPEDITEAIELGDVDQLRDAMVQMYGEAARPFIKHPKRGTGKHHRARGMDDAVDDYYFIRDLLRRTYLGPDEKRLYKWHKKVTEIIAEFHDVRQDSLDERVTR